MRRNSIGNDIVALNSINAARTIQPKFYSKFLTPAEVGLYENYQSKISFVQFAWLCWSIKESVFKFQKRLQPELVFGYKKIIIQEINFIEEKNRLTLTVENILIENCFSNITKINDVEFYTSSIVTSDFIYSCTVENEIPAKLYWEIKKIDDAAVANQSASVRELSAQKIKNVLGDEHIDFIKSETGFPFIQRYPQILLSFTHHNNFIGYAFLAEGFGG